MAGASMRGEEQMDEALRQLRSDVDFLASSLGRVICDLEGQRFFDLVEEVRSLTKRLRSEPNAGSLRTRLKTLLSKLSLSEAERLVRAFTIYFQLINLAEEIHRVRVNRLREGQASPDAPRRESVAAAVKALRDGGWSHMEARRFIENLDIGLTLTAHPTEVKRYTVRLKLERIATAVRQLGEQDLSPQGRAQLEGEIAAEIATLWQTRELFSQKPSVTDEAKSALYYFRRSLMDAVPRLMLDIEDALARYYPGHLQSEDEAGSWPPLPPVVRFRSWIGGDRDGNPFVTPEVTTEAYALQGQVALERHIGDVDLLVQRLSQWQARAELSEALRQDLERLEGEQGAPDRFAEEPYRQKLFYMHRGLVSELEQIDRPADSGTHPGYPGSARGYALDLSLIGASLRQGRGQRVAEAFVRPTIYRAAAFGFHLAALDLREHSRVHEVAVADLLRYAGVEENYQDLDEEGRIRILTAELSTRRPLAPPDAALESETLRALAFLGVFRRIQAKYGEEATGAYIVSMTEGVSDVLEVLILAKEAGLSEIDPVPLFETAADLDAAAGVLERLFAIRPYREHIRKRGVQEVMIGYSDSNKDAGFLSANWALYTAQERIAATCHEAGITLRLFHGRGTSIGRGGGPAGRAILAQPPGSLGGRMRLTEQGEALADRYSDADLAHRHLEQVTHAFITSSARDAKGDWPEVPQRYRDALATAALAAERRYRSLLETDGFLDFFHCVTPIEEISRLNIGSRPARRKGARALSNLRAIPWVFSWTQCRANLPGWFGLGTGLASIEPTLLREMYEAWPFFGATIDLAQMSLAKADMGVFESYLQLVPERLTDRFWPEIRGEYEFSLQAVRKSTGKELLENDPTLARGIELRNPYVDPISHLQVELLKRLRSAEGEDAEADELDYAVLVSLTGISAGMRNTG